MPRIQERTIPQEEARRNILVQKTKLCEYNIAELEGAKKKAETQAHADLMGKFLYTGKIQKIESDLVKERKELEQAQNELAELNSGEAFHERTETAYEHGTDIAARINREGNVIIERGEEFVTKHRGETPEKERAIRAVGAQAAEISEEELENLQTFINELREGPAQAARRKAAPDAAAGAGTEAGAPTKKSKAKRPKAGSGAEGTGGVPPPGETGTAGASPEGEDGEAKKQRILSIIREWVTSEHLQEISIAKWGETVGNRGKKKAKAYFEGKGLSAPDLTKVMEVLEKFVGSKGALEAAYDATVTAPPSPPVGGSTVAPRPAEAGAGAIGTVVPPPDVVTTPGAAPAPATVTGAPVPPGTPPDTTPVVPQSVTTPVVDTTPVAASVTGVPAPRVVDAAPAVVVPAPVAARELTRKDSKVESYESEMQALDTAIQTFVGSLTWEQFGEPRRNLWPKIADIVRTFAPKLGFSDNQGIVTLTDNYYEKLLEKVEETLKIGVARANEKKVTEILGINLKEEGKQLMRSLAGGGIYGGAIRIASGLTRVTEKVLTTAFLPARLVAIGVGAVHGFIAGGLSATATEVGAKTPEFLRNTHIFRKSGPTRLTHEEKIKNLYRDFTAGMQKAHGANNTTKLEYLDTIQKNLPKGVGANLRGLVSFDMRRHIQIADIRAMKSGVTFATGGSDDIDRLLEYAENGRFKDNKKERDEREKLLAKVSSNGTLEVLIRSVIEKEATRLLVEEGETGLTPGQKEEVRKHAILSVERTMNALLGDLVVQEKTSGLTERYGLEYMSKIFRNEPPETWTQRFLRGGVNGAIAGAIMKSGPEAAAIYMGLTRFGSGIRSEMLKRRGDDRPVRTADEILHDLAAFTAGATIDVGSARDKIIDARARIKLPDMKEADRARIEDAIDKLELAMMKRGTLEAAVDENNKVLKIKYQNVEANKKAVALAEDEKARKAWLFSKEAILVKYAKMFTEKGSSWEATKILAKSGMVGTFSAMAGALGAGAVDVGWAGGEAAWGGQSFDIGTEVKVTMGSAVDRATFGHTDFATTTRVHAIEAKLNSSGGSFNIADGYTAAEKEQVTQLPLKDQATIEYYVNHLVHDGTLLPIGAEYLTLAQATEVAGKFFDAIKADGISASELASISHFHESVQKLIQEKIDAAVKSKELEVVYDGARKVTEYVVPKAEAPAIAAPEAEKPEEMTFEKSTNPHERRDKGIDPIAWQTIEGFADKGHDYMTINLDVKDAVGMVKIRIEGGQEVADKVKEWIDTSGLKTTGEIWLTGEEKGGDRLFIAGAKDDTAVLIFRSMTTGHPEDGLEMMCEMRHADGGEYNVEGVGIKDGAFDGLIRGAVKMDGASDSAQADMQRYHSDVRIDTNHDGTPETATAIEFKANQYGDERVSAYEYTDADDAETHIVDLAVADHNAKPVDQKYLSQEMGSDAPGAILHGAYENGEWKPVVDQDIASLAHVADVRHDDIGHLPDPAGSTTAEYLAVVEAMTATLNNDPFDYNSATHEFTYWNGKGFDRTSLSVPEGASVVEDKPGHFQVKIGDNVVKEGTLSFDKTTSTWTMEDKGTSTNLDEFDDDVDTAVLNHGVENTWVANDHKDENIAILKNAGAFDAATQKFTFGGFTDSDDAHTFVARFQGVIDGNNQEQVRLAFNHRTEDPRTIERIIDDAPMLNTRLGISTLENAFLFEQLRFSHGTKFEFPGTDGVKVDRPDNLPDLFIDASGIHAIKADGGEHGPAVLVDDLLNQTKLDVGVNKAVTLLATQEAAKLAVGTFAVGETPLLSEEAVKEIRGSTWENFVKEEWAPNDVRAGAREEVRANIMEKLLALRVVVKQGDQYVPDPAYLAARHHTAAEFKVMAVDDILQEAVTNNAKTAEYVVKVSAGVKAVEGLLIAGEQKGWGPDLSRGAVPYALDMDASVVEGLTDAQYAKEIARLAGWSWMGTQQDNLENVHKEIVKIIHEMQKPEVVAKLQAYDIQLSPVRPNVGDVLQAYQQLKMIERGEARLLPGTGYNSGTPMNPTL